MKKEIQVVMLPTSRKADIGIWKVIPTVLTQEMEGIKPNKLYFGKEKISNAWKVGNIECQHLYFLSDEIIPFGSFYYKDGEVFRFFIEKVPPTRGSMWIIATTDPGLGLPRPSNEFLQKYCELGSVDKVLVEYNDPVCQCDTFEKTTNCCFFKSYDGSCTKPDPNNDFYGHKLKIAPDNTISTYRMK